MTRTLFLVLALAAAAPVRAEAPIVAADTQPTESPRRTFEGRYVLTGCAVRWERAYDGYGGYVGERKVKICD